MSRRGGHRTRNKVDKGPVRNVTARSIRRSILAAAQLEVDLHSSGLLQVECDVSDLTEQYFQDLLRENASQPSGTSSSRPKVRVPFYFIGDGVSKLEAFSSASSRQVACTAPSLRICLSLPRNNGKQVLNPEVLVPSAGDTISFCLDGEMTKGFRKGLVSEVTYLGKRHAGRRMALVSFKPV